jgi:hypothetical protein
MDKRLQTTSAIIFISSMGIHKDCRIAYNITKYAIKERKKEKELKEGTQKNIMISRKKSS